MKTKEELNTLKEEYASLNKKLGELTDDEMEQVTGGMKIVVIKTSQEPSNTSGISGSVNEPIMPDAGGEKQDQACGIFPGLPAFP